MSAVNAPFGFRPAYHPSGIDRARAYTIGSAYATAIHKGTPVLLNTDGTINIGAAAADLLGVFDGVEYIDATGKPTVSNFWPAAQVATAITAWVWDDPLTVYDVQADGSLAATSILDQADITNIGGSNSTGLSTTTLSSTLKGVGVQGQFRVQALNLDPNNTWGDAFTVVQVTLARSQVVANKVAI